MYFGLYYYFVIREKPNIHDRMMKWSARESLWDYSSINHNGRYIHIHHLLTNLGSLFGQMVEFLIKRWNAPINIHKIYFPDESS